MNFLREVFPEFADIAEELLKNDFYLSPTESALLGIAALILLPLAHLLLKGIVEDRIVNIGYPWVDGRILDKRQKKWSFSERFFLTRLRREAEARHFSVCFYWAFQVLNCLCMPVSVFACISIFVTQGAGWSILLSLSLLLGLPLIPAILTYIYDMLFIPEARKKELDRYRWKSDKKKKKDSGDKKNQRDNKSKKKKRKSKGNNSKKGGNSKKKGS